MKRNKKHARKRKYWRRKNSTKTQKAVPQPAESARLPAYDTPRKAVVSESAMERIIQLVEGDVHHECGAFLIGNLLTDHITGDVLAVVDDIYTDGCYGTSSNYTFTARHQRDALVYIYRTYGRSKHMIGTVHSHAQFDSFYSGTDYQMMNSRLSEEIHLVLSPSHKTYVLTYKDLKYDYHNDIVFETSLKHGYRRNKQ